MKKINIQKFISNYFGESCAFSTSKSVTFNGPNFQMEVRKDGHECRSRKSKPKWYHSQYLTVSILVICEIIFYIITGRVIYDSWYFPMLVAVIILLLSVYTYIFSDYKLLRMNHGAEHKVINAFMRDDLKNVDKYSRFSEVCGGNIYSILLILMLMSPMIGFPFSIFLIYMIIYDNLKPVRIIFFNTIGKAVQHFTTAEPTKEILENTRMGFRKLLYVEVEKILKDAIEEKASQIENKDSF